VPRFWRVPKKERTWVVSPRPGPHKKFECIPLLIIVRDILKIVDNAKDAKKIIKSREIFVDGKPRRDHKYPVGLFDVVEIPKLRKQYRVVLVYSL
jgi:small subunit ribosomal protein S4e